jgi:hypothetical protein
MAINVWSYLREYEASVRHSCRRGPRVFFGDARSRRVSSPFENGSPPGAALARGRRRQRYNAVALALRAVGVAAATKW